MERAVSVVGWTLVVSCVLAWVACDRGADSRDKGGAGGAGAEAGTTTAGGGGAGAATTTSTAGAGGSAGSPQPCTPPGESPPAEPTAGRCHNGAAVTCSGATATLVTNVCAPDQECLEYLAQEYIFDSVAASGWDLTRQYQWAGCVPADAAPCAYEFSGTHWASPDHEPQCSGDAKVYCAMAPLPEYELGNAQMLLGTEAAYVAVESCPPGETCRQALGSSAVDCFSVDASPCSSHAESCVADVLHYCDLDFGYEREVDCTQSDAICRPACDPAHVSCVASGSQSCHPDTHAEVCSTEVSYTACANCNTREVDCTWVTKCGSNGCHSVPGRCEVLQGEATCIDASAVLCDPDAAEACNGSLASRCPIGIVVEVDCASDGLECYVGQGDQAGCAPSGAQACTIGEPYHCEGSNLVGCCPAHGNFYQFDGQLPCPPGYVAELDCTTIPPGQDCFESISHAECNM